MTIISLFLLATGLFLLWFAGELVVRYALQCAYLADLPVLFIGFFIISLATGLPELTVVANSIWWHYPGLSVGDIIGSNFFDLAMGLGIPAVLMRPILISRAQYTKTLFMLISTLLLMLFIITRSTLHHWHGFVLISMYAFINWLSFKIKGKNEINKDDLEHVAKTLQQEWFFTSTFGTFLKLIGAIALVLLASYLAVSQAIAIVTALGYSIVHFGATFMALGTSLPELTLSITAIKNKEYDLALGNSFGSIWDQGGLMMGILALFNPTPISLQAIASIKPFIIIAYAIVAFFIIQKRSISRIAGILLIGTYVGFILFEMLFAY